MYYYTMSLRTHQSNTLHTQNDLLMKSLLDFYEDKAKYAFPFQMMAYISRLALLKNTIKQIMAY